MFISVHYTLLYYNCCLFKGEEKLCVHSRDRRRSLSKLCWHFLKHSSFFAVSYQAARECCSSRLWHPIYYHISLVMNLSICRNVVWTVRVLCLSHRKLIVTRSVPVAGNRPQRIFILHDWRYKRFSVHIVTMCS